MHCEKCDYGGVRQVRLTEGCRVCSFCFYQWISMKDSCSLKEFLLDKECKLISDKIDKAIMLERIERGGKPLIKNKDWYPRSKKGYVK